MPSKKKTEKAELEEDVVIPNKETEIEPKDLPAGPGPEEEEDLSDEALAKNSAEIAAKIGTRQESLKKEITPRLFTEAEVRAMLAQVGRDKENGMDLDEEDDESKAPKIIRVPRFQNRFIVAFKNLNADEYFPDREVFSMDIWDERTRQNVPHVTVLYHDGTELNIRLETVLKQANMVNCELVERLEKDISYNDGKVEKVEVKDYSRVSTGNFIKAKVTLKKYSFKVKLPNGEIIVVTPDVINWRTE